MILVTGAGGLLGSHVAEQGLARALPLRFVTRSLSRRSFLHDRTEVVQGVDFSQGEIPEFLLQGVETVIHCAGDAVRAEAAENNNLFASRNLFLASQKAGVKHWIQVSSVAALGHEGLITEESASPRPTPYARAKAATDHWLLSQIQGGRQATQISILYPTYMLGRYDSRPGSGAVLVGMRLRRLQHFLDGRKNFVSPADVARAILDVAQAGKSRRLLLSGVNTSISEFVAAAARQLQMDPATFTVHASRADLPEMPEGQARFLDEFCQSADASHARATAEIAYQPKHSLPEMLADLHGYLRRQKMIL